MQNHYLIMTHTLYQLSYAKTRIFFSFGNGSSITRYTALVAMVLAQIPLGQCPTWSMSSLNPAIAARTCRDGLAQIFLGQCPPWSMSSLNPAVAARMRHPGDTGSPPIAHTLVSRETS